MGNPWGLRSQWWEEALLSPALLLSSSCPCTLGSGVQALWLREDTPALPSAHPPSPGAGDFLGRTFFLGTLNFLPKASPCCWVLSTRHSLQTQPLLGTEHTDPWRRSPEHSLLAQLAQRERWGCLGWLLLTRYLERLSGSIFYFLACLPPSISPSFPFNGGFPRHREHICECPLKGGEGPGTLNSAQSSC